AVREWSTPSEPCRYEPPKDREDHAEGDAPDHDGHRCRLVRWLPGDLEERECRQREDEVPDNDGNDRSGHVAVPEVNWCLTNEVTSVIETRALKGHLNTRRATSYRLK